MPPTSFALTSTSDPGEALRWFAELVAREPVAMSVIASVTAGAEADASRYAEPRWWAGRDGDTVVAAFMRTPPHPLHIGLATSEQARALARSLDAADYDPGGVGGPREAAEAFRDEWVGLTGAAARTVMALGVFDLPSGPRLPFPVRGAYRIAQAADLALVDRWMEDFHDEATPSGPPAPSLARHLADGRVGLWIVDETPVSMAFASRAMGGVTRISGVWTPPGLRGNGYASAVVAALSADRMARGERCMLYTDLANPTSNAIYQALGYRRVGDSVTIAFA